ncbi:HNH endonuclease [Microvirga tunisiensis]|uniref:HNH endonuclease n=1 Tax=Pannonibacter tanglangensis TaxID=2750084 RepID=A0A7X5J9U5_9HYPH|nr:HNH endonuclease signature motif containing protein [Pannonibacter sp. XCT-53]NBN78690.1 HNH endonuclease [Pannonibacter sp. XCT-53]
MAKLTMMRPRLGAMPSSVQAMPKVAASIYQSAEWRKFAADIKRQRGGACEVCGSRNRVIADHIVELKDGGEPFNPQNIQLLCHPHHQAKTAAARARRASGVTG